MSGKGKRLPKAGPVTIRKPDGTEETKPAYIDSKLRQIIGHGRDESRVYGKRAPRSSRVEQDY